MTSIIPVRAQLQGVTADEADHIDDWQGRLARAVTAGSAQLPELAEVDSDLDGFDPETMSGEFVAFPSVLGRPYRMGFFTWHQLEPGCFDASIAEQGGRLPTYVQHNYDWSERPPIGHTRETAEVDFADDDGDTRAIRIAGRLYPDIPDGLACLHAMAARALREWSITYLIEEYTVVEDDEDLRTTLHVTRAQLWEPSIVLRGANPWTRTEDVAGDFSGRLDRAARLLGVSVEQLAAFVTQHRAAPAPGDDDQVDDDAAAEIAGRVARLEARSRLPLTVSRHLHRQLPTAPDTRPETIST